jgi:hypothetical protein
VREATSDIVQASSDAALRGVGLAFGRGELRLRNDDSGLGVVRRFEHRQELALLDVVADLDQQFLQHGPGDRGRRGRRAHAPDAVLGLDAPERGDRARLGGPHRGRVGLRIRRRPSGPRRDAQREQRERAACDQELLASLPRHGSFLLGFRIRRRGTRPSSAWILPSRRGRSTGLVSYSSQPAAIDFSRSPTIACAVSAITGTPAVFGIRLQLARELVAVLAGQVDVHEHEVEPAGLERAAGLVAVHGDEHVETLALETPRQHVAVHLVVLDQQYRRHG